LWVWWHDAGLHLQTSEVGSWLTLVSKPSKVESFCKPKLPRGSSSLKQALLVEFKIWESTRNLCFPMIQICCVILALKVLMALLTAAWYIISLAWVLGHPKVIACTICQISDYQRHAAVPKTAKIWGKVADATTCPHSKYEPMPLFEDKIVTICLLFTNNLQLVINWF
jgi:hypothetical protein